MQLRPLASWTMEAVAPGCGAGPLAHASQGLALGGHWEGTTAQVSTPLPKPWEKPPSSTLTAPAQLPGLWGLALGHFLGSSLGFHALSADMLCCRNYSRLGDKVSPISASQHLPLGSWLLRGGATPLLQGSEISKPNFSLQTPGGWSSLGHQCLQPGGSDWFQLRGNLCPSPGEVSTWRRSPWLGWLRTNSEFLTNPSCPTSSPRVRGSSWH